MADVIYFSGELQSNGEVKFKRRDEHIDYNPAPLRIEVVIHDKAKRQYPCTDPTLTVFHDPKKDDK